MQERRAKVTLIVVELGSEWPPGLCEKPGTGERRVVAQLEGESPLEFAERLKAFLETERLQLRAATLLCNERVDPEQTRARELLIEAVRGRLSRSKTADLTFSASDRALRSLPAATAW